MKKTNKSDGEPDFPQEAIDAWAAVESLMIGGQPYTVTSEYDLRSRRKKVTYPDSSTWERTYTARRQLHETKYNGSTAETRVYDDGRRLDTSTYANGVAADYNWRADNLLADIGFSHPGGVAANRRIGTYTYAWDANKNKTKETITGQISGFSFDTTLGTDPDGYDEEDRLTYFKRQSTTNPQTWDLSLVGDWNSWSNFGTAQSRTHGPAHEILTAGNTPNNAFTHDVKGNTTDIPSNILSPARKLFWDFDNQLTGVDTTGDSTPEVTYEYDVMHTRVARIEGSNSKVYIHSGNQIIVDYNRGPPHGTAPVFRYVWGDYIDEPILRQSATGTVLYFHHNQQYSTVALTNTSGEVVERYGYTAYGQMTVMNYLGNVRSWSDWSNRFLYTGREWDDTTKLFHFRARWYEPVAGRFVSRDPLGYVDGMGIYASYVMLGVVDPHGTRCGFSIRLDSETDSNQADNSFSDWSDRCNQYADVIAAMVNGKLDTAWRNYSGITQPFLETIELSEGEMLQFSRDYSLHNHPDIMKLYYDCNKFKAYWINKETGFGGNPSSHILNFGFGWQAALGGVRIKVVSSCHCNKLCYTISINDKFDFENIRNWSSLRTFPRNAQVIAVLSLQLANQCDWKPFYHRGELKRCGYPGNQLR